MTEIPVHEDTTAPIDVTIPHEIAHYPIESVDTSSNTVTVAEDKRNRFAGGETFEIEKSSGNDGTYTVLSTDYSITDDATTISVGENITDSTSDGTVSGGSVSMLVGEDESPKPTSITRAGSGETIVSAPLDSLSLSSGNLIEIKWKLTFIDGTVLILPPSGDVLRVEN